MARSYRIRNWAKFQHYRDRNPPWIKLHVEILASEDWVTLDDASKLLAIVCMVIAAKHDGNVPDNPDYIKRVAYLGARPNLTPLVECGFLEEPLADASALQPSASARKQTVAVARPEKETPSSKESNKSEQSQKEERPRAEKARSPSKPKTPIPDHFPDDEARRKAQEVWSKKGRPDLAASVLDEMEHFRDHHISHATTSADWAASWRTWIKKAPGFTPQQRANGNGRGRPESPYEQTQRIANKIISGDKGADFGADRGPRIELRPAADDRRGAGDLAPNVVRRLGAPDAGANPGGMSPLQAKRSE